MNFQTLLKIETLESVYVDKDPNHMFNSFLCTFFNIFQASFPVEHKSVKDKNDGMTQGTKISCKRVRSLYVFTKNSNDSKAKYIKYCEILRKFMKEAKKQHYSRLIVKSNNNKRNMVHYKERNRKCTFSGIRSYLTCE
jgi:hypothetical protein